MKIGDMEIYSGEKKSGWITVEGTSYRLPVTAVCGGSGKTTVITGGIHSAEHVGVQAVVELAEELQPRETDGTVILVPVVNVSGYQHRGTSMVWEDGKNLNREFPGDANGTVGDKICRTVADVLFSAADYYVDLHCGDYYEDLHPYVYYVGPVEEQVRKTAREMAACVGVEYVVESQTTTGGAYNYASASGIPSILLERGGRGLWSTDEVEADKADVRRILNYLYGKDSGCGSFSQTLLTDVRYENAPCCGCWYPFFPAGHICEKGDVLGEIRDYFGKALYICRAAERCVILYQTVSLNLPQGSPMIAYGCLEG